MNICFFVISCISEKCLLCKSDRCLADEIQNEANIKDNGDLDTNENMSESYFQHRSQRRYDVQADEHLMPDSENLEWKESTNARPSRQEIYCQQTDQEEDIIVAEKWEI